MDVQTVKRSFLSGSLVGLARVGLAVPLYLVLTPFVLDKLGSEMFGIWSFSTLVVSLITLTDFGFKNSLIYHVAGHIKRPEEVNRFFNVAFFFYLIAVLSAMVAIVALDSLWVARLLNVPISLQREAHFVLVITAIGFGLRFLAIPWQALVEAHQEHFFSQIVMLVWLAVNFVSTLVALEIRPDIYSLGVAGIVPNLLVFLMYVWRTKQQFPHIRISPFLVDRSRCRTMFNYGVGIQVATLAIACREPVFKILVAHAFDLATVASFEIAFKLCTQLVSLVMAPLSGTFAASALFAKKEKDLEQFIRPLFGYAFSLLVPLALLIVSFGPFFAQFWLGSESGLVGELLPPMFLAFAIYYLTEVLYKSLEASGLSLYSAIIQVAVVSVSVVNFLLSSDAGSSSIGLGLLAGFCVFSFANSVIFRWRFRTVTLISRRAFLGIVLTAACFLSSLEYWSGEMLIPLFAFYALLHVWWVHKCQVVNLPGLAWQVAGLIRNRGR
ncbi:hypothetical protein [Methylocaldum sp. GT1BB]|uniref:hypothetical protein n=1 Tax=Methylocaldum sp. GT1BB TaxID=3438963 RepID=UPI003DA01566